MVAERQGLLFVVSGPSGAGKGTLLRHLSQVELGLHQVMTYTTRPPRAGEGPLDYTFVDRDSFFDLVAKNQIWEYTQTYGDHYYGSPTTLLTDDGKTDLLTEVEVKGMLRLRAFSKRRVVSIFVLPPSLKELEQRIEKRHREANSAERIQKAKDQLGYATAYDYILLNQDQQRFIELAETIVRAETARSRGTGLLLEHFGDALLRS